RVLGQELGVGGDGLVGFAFRAELVGIGEHLAQGGVGLLRLAPRRGLGRALAHELHVRKLHGLAEANAGVHVGADEALLAGGDAVAAGDEPDLGVFALLVGL